MKKRCFGLDIGTTSIKTVLIRHDSGSYFLDAVAVSPSNPKFIASDAISDLQELAGVIKQMLDKANLSIKDVAISLPESRVYTKVVEMPQLSENELSAALKFELEQYVPLPVDQVRADWQILRKKEEGGKRTMEVMIVAAPVVLLAKYERLMKLLGLNSEVIETEIISIHRALLPLMTAPDDGHIVVHIGASTTNVAVVLGGTIVSVFTISQAGDALSRAVGLDLSIDFVQAENYKKAYGLTQDAFEGKIGRAIQPVLSSICGDIKKAMLLFRERYNKDIKQVILSGGSSFLPGIDIYFTNVLGAQVVLGNCFAAYNIANVPEQVEIEAPNYNVAAGLALRNI